MTVSSRRTEKDNIIKTQKVVEEIVHVIKPVLVPKEIFDITVTPKEVIFEKPVYKEKIHEKPIVINKKYDKYVPVDVKYEVFKQTIVPQDIYSTSEIEKLKKSLTELLEISNQVKEAISSIPKEISMPKIVEKEYPIKTYKVIEEKIVVEKPEYVKKIYEIPVIASKPTKG